MQHRRRTGLARLAALATALLWFASCNPQANPQDAGSLETRLAPEWVQHAPLRESFVRLLTPPDPESASERQYVTYDEWLQGEDDKSSLRAAGRMTRILQSGHEFETDLALTSIQHADEIDVELDVQRGGSWAITYFAKLQESQPVRVQYRTPETEPEIQEMDVGGEAPIGIGDVQVRDVTNLLSAWKSGDYRSVGGLEMKNAVTLEVLEFDLAAAAAAGEDNPNDSSKAPNAAPTALEDFTARASRALVYLEPNSQVPRTVRVFDIADRLVRTYNIFYGGDGDDVEVNGLLAQSLPSSSTTMFYMESLSYEPE